jgi:hypothetical protein
MTATLYLAPTTDAALARARAQVQAAQQTDPLASVHFLLPTAEAIRQVHEHLGNTMNVRLRQFCRLGHTILDQARQPVHEVRDLTARRLVHHLLSQMLAQGVLTTFAAVWDKPGFTQVLQGLGR